MFLCINAKYFPRSSLAEPPSDIEPPLDYTNKPFNPNMILKSDLDLSLNPMIGKENVSITTNKIFSLQFYFRQDHQLLLLALQEFPSYHPALKDQSN